MTHIEIADRAGVRLSDLDELMKGKATMNVARRLGLTRRDIESFIAGRATASMVQLLGLKTPSAVVELSTVAGREGAIGVLLGVLISEHN